MAEDRMLSDEILLGLIKANSGGGGGGTSNYNDLSNKPQIGGVTLSGNKSASDLGLVAAEAGKGLSTNDYTDADKAIVGGVTAALAGKQGALTAGSHIAIDDDTISVNRWAVPAGKVVYTIITSDENYGQNVHVQRHTLGGALIDDRVYLVQSWQTKTVDDVISIEDQYAKYKITLLKDSDEQSAGYYYMVNPTTTPTSNSFTFTMPQEENDNDLIIREELDAKQDKLTFDDTPTDNSNNPVKSNGIYDALALKQDKTDNALQTTDKTVVGAINEHEGDIDSLKSGLTNVDVALDVPENSGKNLITMTLTDIKSSNTNGTWADNVYTLDGLVFTVLTDSDGNVIGVKANGTAPANDTYFTLGHISFVKDTSYRMTSGTTGSTAETYRLWAYSSTAFPVGHRLSTDSNCGENVARDARANERCPIAFMIMSGYAPNNVTVYPMVRFASVSDPTYAPYIPSVDARLDAVESGLTDVQSGLTSITNQIQGLNSIYKTTRESAGNVTFTTTANRFTGFLFITANNGKYAIYTVNRTIAGGQHILKLIGDDFTISYSDGVITVTIDSNWSKATLITDEVFS